MFEDALSTWRTREGTALLAAYGALIAAASAVFAYAPETARAYDGTPPWLRFLPVAVPLLLIFTLAVIPPLRRQAYRLQLLNVGTFFVTLVIAFFNARNGPPALLIVVICMFGVQYAFMRWQELVLAYAAAVLAFAATALMHHTLSRHATTNQLEVLAGVAAACVTLSALRLRSWYHAANERLALERYAAELRRQTERSSRMAYTDSLTGLYNRAGMYDLIDRALALSNGGDAFTALLYLDLDGFKEINDACGHDAGDSVLVEAALRMQYLLRGGETAGRIGGDEFVIVMPSVHGLEEPRALAKRIEDALSEPFRIGKTAFHLSASIGMAWSGEHGTTRSELLSAADKSMYAVKNWRKIDRKPLSTTAPRG